MTAMLHNEQQARMLSSCTTKLTLLLKHTKVQQQENAKFVDFNHYTLV